MIALAGLFLVGGQVYADNSAGGFPGAAVWITSPDGKYAVGNLDLDTPDKNGNSHELQLKELSSGTISEFLSYGRHVDVVWSPKGSKLSITDYAGSDNSDCLVFDPKEIQSPIALTALLKKQVPDFPSLMKDSHLYVECSHWVDEDSLRVIAQGWNDYTHARIRKTYQLDLLKNSVTERTKK